MEDFIFLFTNEEAKYKQIYQQIKWLIEQRRLTTNDSLPSIRRLAETLHVSRNTTLTAYEQLVAEGYIRGERRKGYFVNEFEKVFLQEEEWPSLSQEIKTNSGDVIIDFRAGAVDQQHFPLKIWRQMANQVLPLQKCYEYGDPFGEPLLKEQLVHYLLQARGVHVNEEDIIIGSSTQQMLIYLGFLLKQDFPSVILEDPGYNGARDAFKLHDFQIETLPVSEKGAKLEHLKHLHSRLLYVTPSHHFPYGVSMIIQQRQALIQWAKKVDGYILEDDYDSEFRYTQQPFPALASLDKSRVIYMGTFSKSFLPAIRLSYMVLPKSLVQPYKERFAHFEHNASSLHQLTMGKFMEQGEWTRHIKRMRITYKYKINALVEELNKQFGEKITILGEQSGLYILVKVQTQWSEEQLIQHAQQYGVKVYPTSPYFLQQPSSIPIIQLGFSKLKMEDIILGVQLLRKAWITE
ncbi:PLP-dependent aminotransferase family protein [Lysinibacillus sphaericus]|uniref:PLP-dependent aminotransferase family protein n=1 Tax=Lysinibacillus sphaericus TaxID=1421 RepID=A0A544UTB0_LYSSH|nr:PLP-dependent aminotransferase family protein [Lysinibacillus sp. SDF0037]TQR37085.1 PLP-dependent aminotransferase family protein [Lysinibacillus sp. SDF0037]